MGGPPPLGVRCLRSDAKGGSIASPKQNTLKAPPRWRGQVPWEILAALIHASHRVLPGAWGHRTAASAARSLLDTSSSEKKPLVVDVRAGRAIFFFKRAEASMLRTS